MIADSFRVHTVPGTHFEQERMDYRKSLSDHFPITLDLKVQDDDDFTIQQAMATEDAGIRAARMATLQEDAFERASRSTTLLSSDQEDDELLIDFEVRDENFEEILAPDNTPVGVPGDGTSMFGNPSSSGTAMISSSSLGTARSAGTSGASSSTNTNSAVIPEDRFARSDLPVVFLEQNWTPAESVEFYSLRQGSPLMRKDFFDVLEQPDSTDRFRDSDYLASFGFLPRRPHPGNFKGYPVGFTGNRAIELTCAACHTSRLTYGGKEYWIDGSQAITDMESWLGELVKAIKLTDADAPDLSQFSSNQQIDLDQGTKFGRFVRSLTGRTSPSVAQAKAIQSLLKQELERRQRYNDYNAYGKTFNSDAERSNATPHGKYGYSRLDALGAILNQASAEHLDAPDNARQADAPVNFPAIWDAPQHNHVQWNGSVDNRERFGPLGRNAGQVVGVFGLVETEGTNVGYDSSINFDAIERAEELITKLWSPEWPDDFGAIDPAKAAAGKALYTANCVNCHAIIDRDDPRRKANDVLIPIDRVYGANGILGTDPLAAKNWQDRKAKIKRLAGRNITLPFRGRFPGDPEKEVPAREILSHMVFNSIARSFVPWRDELTIEDEHSSSMMMFSSEAETENLMRYKARPLNGVWSTSPYLHNGSVLNMVELLQAPANRKSKFKVGSTDFDPRTLGYKDAGPFEFDTSSKGNSNLGHEYGTELSANEKEQLIEYLKTL